jgi:hypothetical protein
MGNIPVARGAQFKHWLNLRFVMVSADEENRERKLVDED